MLNEKTAPKIETNRLIIRLVDLSDAFSYFKFCSDPIVCQYLTFTPYNNLKQASVAISNMIRAYLSGSDLNFTILLKDSKVIIGSISLTFLKDYNGAEIGYILDRFYWHNGYMGEALKAIIRASFEYFNLDFLIANYIDENILSAKLLQKNNFVIYQHSKNAFSKENKVYNLTSCFLKK